MGGGWRGRGEKGLGEGIWGYGLEALTRPAGRICVSCRSQSDLGVQGTEGGSPPSLLAETEFYFENSIALQETKMEIEVWEDLSLPRLEWCRLGAETRDYREALSPTSAPFPGLPKGITHLSPSSPTPIPTRPPAPFRTSFSLQVRKASS